MADPVDTAPTTSYSDPIYDRLEALSNRIRRAKWIIIIAIIVAVVGGVVLRSTLQNRPEARSAVAFVSAQQERDDAQRRTALAAVADDDKATAFFRARAALELVQLELADGKADAAATWVSKATHLAADVDDDQLGLAVRSAQAAVAEDAGQLEEALALYDSVASSGLVASPTHGLVAVLGAARIELAQGKAEAAIERLEPHIERIEPELDQILSIVRLLYWQAKRAVAGAPAVVADPNAPAEPAAPAAPVPTPETGEATAVGEAAAEAAPAAE